MRITIVFFFALASAILLFSCRRSQDYDEYYSACLDQAEKVFFEVPETGERGFGYVDFDLRCVIGAPLPSFDLTGGLHSINSDSLYGKPSVIYFWMTSCKPCLKHIEVFNNLVEDNPLKEKVNYTARQMPNRVVVLG